MRSLKSSILIILVLCVWLQTYPSFAMTQQSTTAAELVQDERVIYALPDVGTIIPTHPLFFFKQLRDELQTVITLNSYEKLKLKLKLSDRYIAYAQALAVLNKPARTVEAIQTAVDYQYESFDLLQDLIEDPTDSATSEHIQETRMVFAQANIKQAEIIRSLLTVLPRGEQDKLLATLDRNISLKKNLNALP